MMQRVPETQVMPPFTGSFVGVEAGSVLGSFLAIQPVDWMTTGLTGTVGFIGGSFIDRSPLAWGGSGTNQFTYTANTAAGAYDNITGCFCDFVAKEQRDYLVLLSVCWQWQSANWSYQILHISLTPAAVTIAPSGGWRKSRDSNPTTTDFELRTVQFVLPNLPRGSYRVQALHSPFSSSQDRKIWTAYVTVL